MNGRSLLVAFPAVVLSFAAADTVGVRLAHPNQPFDPLLLGQLVALWGTFTFGGLILATIWHRIFRRGSSDGESPHAGRAVASLATFTVLPVVAHWTLDRHTALGQNVDALMSARPWLETLGAVLVTFALGWGLALVLSRLPGRLSSVGIPLVALLVGLFLPRPDGLPDPPAQRPAELADKPNVLLLVWDTARWDHTAPAGYTRETTPQLAKFAEESLVFEHARSVSVFTFTSHLSMLTGLYPAATGARLFRMQVDPSLSESMVVRLNDSGYRTGAFVGTWVLSATTGIQRGFEIYDDVVDPAVSLSQGWRLVHDVQAVLDKLDVRQTNGMPHWFQDFQRPADDVLERAQAWIERDDPRPWFCFVNLYDVHWPYLPDHARVAEGGPPIDPYDGPMDGYLFRSDAFPSGYEPDDVDGRHVADLYDRELWELDRRVAAFLDALDLDRTNTAVILTSDHGEAFGEGGRYQHEDILEPQVRIPLLVRLPGASRPVGRRTEPVSGVDIAPTLLSLAGLEIPEELHGVDLLDESAADPNREVLVEDRDQPTHVVPRLVLYDGDWKLVRSGTGEHLKVTLHDLASDPVGLLDVSVEHPDRLAAMEARLDEIRAPWAGVDDGVELVGLGASAEALSGLGYLEDAGSGP